jgi:hypothetical protein
MVLFDQPPGGRCRPGGDDKQSIKRHLLADWLQRTRKNLRGEAEARACPNAVRLYSYLGASTGLDRAIRSDCSQTVARPSAPTTAVAQTNASEERTESRY